MLLLLLGFILFPTVWEGSKWLYSKVYPPTEKIAPIKDIFWDLPVEERNRLRGIIGVPLEEDPTDMRPWKKK